MTAKTACIFVVLSVLCGCAQTPTVEQVNAQNAKFEDNCKAKGYTPGSKDFQTCMMLEEQKPMNDARNIGMGLGAASIGLQLLSISDIRVKTDIHQIATLRNGLHLYRFRYKWSKQVYVGVIAQEVERQFPSDVIAGSDGLLRVNYHALGLHMMTWQQWVSQHHSQ